jgi:CBS domain-containing protein
MLVREAMATTVITVGPDTTIRAAAALLADHRITTMPVLDDGGALLGVVGEADIVRGALIPDQRSHLLRVPVREGPEVTYVGEVMTTTPVTVRPDADLAEAVRTMTEHGFKSLPVTEDAHVVGMVSRTDVVTQLARRDDRVRAEVGELLRDEGVDWRFDVVDGVVTVEGPSGEPDRRLAESLVASVRGVVGVRMAHTG